MQENLVLTSADARRPVRSSARTDWQGETNWILQGRGQGIQDLQLVCLGETLTRLLSDSQWSFSSKDIEFRLFN